MSLPHPFLADELTELDREGLRRSVRALPAAGGKIALPGGRVLLNFSSNDYLNLAGDERLKEAAGRAVERYGCGATGSRLMSGHLEIHEQLEDALARLTGRETALAFGSGFLTNLGVLTALAGRDDAIFADRLNHASLIDGARLSGARLHRFRHGDAGHLDDLLKKETKARRRIVVTDSIFSMDGDAAPLAGIAGVARRHGALLMVDEAHAIGVLGPAGGGLCRALPPDLAPDVVVGTLSKSLGGYGGFATGSATLKDFLVNRARGFIYSTGMPPATAAAGLAAAEIIMSEATLGERLMENVRFFHERMRSAECGMRNERQIQNPQSPIIPVMVGDNARALELMKRLEERDVLAVAVRPPTVPAGTARLRLSVTLAHTKADLQHAAGLIADAAREADGT